MPCPDSSTRIAELESSCRRMATERQAITQLREHVLGMRSEVDMHGLLEAIGEALTAVGIGYHNYGVNTVDTSTDPPSIQVSTRLGAGEWRPGTGRSFLFEAWQKAQVLYRRDLHTEDPFDERRLLDRLGAPVRAVVDVPFSHGTLAANSPEPSAFSDPDIAFLQDVAGVLSEGFLRWDDLQALEQRKDELSAEIARREQAQRDLSREFELHRAASAIRVCVAEMQNPEDLVDVVEEIDRQLTHLDIGHLSASIQLVNPEGTGFVAVPLDQPRHLVSEDVQRWMASPPDPYSVEIANRQPWVVEAWRSGKFHYFRAIPDDLGLLAGGSLVDVPFSHGTVGINSPAPDAFGDDDIAVVQRLVGAVSAGIQRYLDLLAQQRARERADHLTLALRAIRNVNQLITREKDRTRLLEQAAHLLIETRGYDAVWIILLKDGGEIAGSVSAGVDPAFQEMATRAGTDHPPPCISRALEQPGTLTIHDPATECGNCPLRGTDEHAGRLLARLEHSGAVYGLLYASLPSAFVADPEEQDLFRELVGDLAFALHDIDAHQRLDREARLREAEATVRLRIAGMREPEDLVRVVEEISTQLSHLEIGHNDCSIQIVNADATDFIHFGSKPAVTDHPFFSEGISWSPVLDHAKRFPWVFDVWRRQEPRYDPSVAQVGRVRSLVDVPFSQGTVAMNSLAPHAFSEEHIAKLQRLAHVLSAGFQRYQDLFERRQVDDQLRQAQKMESVGRLAGGVAHDFNNILTVIKGYTSELLARLPDGDRLHTDASQIDRAADRATTLVRQLLAFSRRQILHPVDVDLNEVVTDAEKMLRHLIGEDIELGVRLADEPCMVHADPGQLEQVIMNLVTNARDAMPDGGALDIETASVHLDKEYADRHAEVEPGPHVVLSLADTGHGMDKVTQQRIFEPFFTTKEVGTGTGLGLSTVQGIVRQSNGHIWVYSEIGRGTTLKIYLPRVGSSESHAQPDRVTADSDDLLGSETILLVEDDEMVRDLARATLQECGYQVLAACDGGEALDIIQRHDEPIHAVVTDVVMPRMSGTDLAARVAEHHPEIRFLFMSGYSGRAVLIDGVLDPDLPFLEKPFGPDDLSLKLRQVLDRP